MGYTEAPKEFDMSRKYSRWTGLIAILAPWTGIALAKAHVIGYNPQTFFGLGVLAAISVGGIIFGLWGAVRGRSS